MQWALFSKLFIHLKKTSLVLPLCFLMWNAQSCSIRLFSLSSEEEKKHRFTQCCNKIHSRQNKLSILWKTEKAGILILSCNLETIALRLLADVVVVGGRRKTHLWWLMKRMYSHVERCEKKIWRWAGNYALLRPWCVFTLTLPLLHKSCSALIAYVTLRGLYGSCEAWWLGFTRRSGGSHTAVADVLRVAEVPSPK